MSKIHCQSWTAKRSSTTIHPHHDAPIQAASVYQPRTVILAAALFVPDSDDEDRDFEDVEEPASQTTSGSQKIAKISPRATRRRQRTALQNTPALSINAFWLQNALDYVPDEALEKDMYTKRRSLWAVRMACCVPNFAYALRVALLLGRLQSCRESTACIKERCAITGFAAANTLNLAQDQRF